jgi:FlaA1/EpsC-like NDP-sugar epimerase
MANSILYSSRARHFLLVAVDGLVGITSYWLALLLRFEGNIPSLTLKVAPLLMGLLALARISSTLLFRVHRWSFRFSGLTDGARVAASSLFGTCLFVLGVFLLRPLEMPPRSVVVLELLMTTAALAVIRFSPRLAFLYRIDRSRARRTDLLRTLIFGAGAAGEMLQRDLHRSEGHQYQVVGFVDDDPAKQGSIVGGVPVLGATQHLPQLIREREIRNLLIAIPRLPAERVREILSLCWDQQIQFKILPVSFVYFQERPALSSLQDLSPEDLLPRDTVLFAEEWQADLEGATALVTGAAGSIGHEICRQLLDRGLARLIMVDMNENGLYLQQRQLQAQHKRAQIVAEVADIRDASRIDRLFAAYRPRDVFHAAAHKHVPLMEQAPCEAVKNNVGGTLHVAEAADRHGAGRFVFISTDKAVRPSSVMGVSKRVGEILIRSLAERSQTRFSAVRFGNVLDSSGSVVPLFREQIARGGPVTVTHPEVRRYFMTTGEAVGLVLRAGYGDFGTLCILEMGEQIPILDLARHMITMASKTPGVDIMIEFTGLRPGEKLFEELLTEEEETTRQVDRKILVAQSQPPPPDFDQRLQRLLAIADQEDAAACLEQLADLVPSFRRPTVDEPAAKP